jgi:hypothetical protein
VVASTYGWSAERHLLTFVLFKGPSPELTVLDSSSGEKRSPPHHWSPEEVVTAQYFRRRSNLGPPRKPGFGFSGLGVLSGAGLLFDCNGVSIAVVYGVT